ncbi:MAG: rRNA (adenine2503-C2)-methyltransferase [Desulfovibrionales bacterium]|jgi:23S rRNA (adenine2503-C2)-methyltransferase|nr:rRNA (adenine2503-C2)-methyltransferase [Desulfovibrionales bacterium]
MPEPANLLNFTLEALKEFAARELGQPGYRADQIYQWIWQKGVLDVEAMTNLSKDLRAKLRECACVQPPKPVETLESDDGTIKLLLELRDGRRIETVLIPGQGYYTQCVSTQVGCAMACSFCSTGTMGFVRNLSRGEILGQILTGRAELAQRGLDPLRNLVFMGMGEPLLNLAAVLESLTELHRPLGMDFSRRRITVSTVGIPNGLEALGRADAALPAISLHAPTQALRERIMAKAAAAMPLDELMAAADRYPLRERERITFEYLLLGGVNDSPSEARELVRLLGQRKCKVNLIAYNDTVGLPFTAPAPQRVLEFEEFLRTHGLSVTLRKSMGADIAAACGQLAARQAQELPSSLT